MFDRSSISLVLSMLWTTFVLAQPSVTTYQGRLESNAVPADGTFNFVFRLCSSAGPGGVLQTFPPAGTVAVDVAGGLFTEQLTFDAAHFTGADRFLEIEVNAVTLAPRQALTACPYAIRALEPGHALDAADGSPADAVFVDNAGNVGIGTTTPARTLEVRAIEATLRLTTTTIVNGSRLEFRNDAASPSLLGTCFFLNSAGQTRGQISYRATDELTFSTAATERVRIDAQGDLGIGVTNPLARLHVNGDIRCDSGHITARSPAGLGVADLLLDTSQDAGGGNWFLLAHANNTPFLGPPGGFSIYNGEHALSIDPARRVGIGTIEPEARMHVLSGTAGTVTAHGSSALVAEGAGHTYVSILSPDANERAVIFGEPSSNVAGGIFYNNPSTPDGLQFRTAVNNTKMVITGAGNVGIGTNTPTDKLTVNGDVTLLSGSITIPATTRFYSISARALIPESTAFDYSVSLGNGVPELMSGGNIFGGQLLRFGAPVHLPHGAVITRLQATVIDNSAAEDVSVLLMRSDAELLGLATSGGTPGEVTLVDSSITSATVANDNFAYSVLVIWEDDAGTPTIHVGRIRIDYTISSPLP